MAVFVFGSNLARRHGKGAAKFAAHRHGAERGVGKGRTGNAYAIPTKGHKLEVLPWDAIRQALERFVAYAGAHPDEDFHLTLVGTGLAGYLRHQLTENLKRIGLPANVLLTASWINDA